MPSSTVCPGDYAPPGGILLVGSPRRPPGRRSWPAGSGRPTSCEMKRLYVRPSGRGSGLARALVTTLLACGRGAGLPPDPSRHSADDGRRATACTSRSASATSRRTTTRRLQAPGSWPERLGPAPDPGPTSCRIDPAHAPHYQSPGTSDAGARPPPPTPGARGGAGTVAHPAVARGTARLPLTIINNQEYVAVDDLAAAVRHDGARSRGRPDHHGRRADDDRHRRSERGLGGGTPGVAPRPGPQARQPLARARRVPAARPVARPRHPARSGAAPPACSSSATCACRAS